jgi:hypothetical protein
MNDLDLDAGPMICALQDSPSDFGRRHNCVRHRPSRHWLAFDAIGSARILRDTVQLTKPNAVFGRMPWP